MWCSWGIEQEATVWYGEAWACWGQGVLSSRRASAESLAAAALLTKPVSPDLAPVTLEPT